MPYVPCPSAGSFPQRQGVTEALQILGGVADTVAQTLTAIRTRQKRQALGAAISDGIEMPEYNEKISYNADLLAPRRRGPPPFDFERLTRFMSYGFLISPVQFHWFAFLSRTFPITKESATIPALQRVGFDQFIFAPFGRPFSIGWKMGLLTS